MGGNFMELKNQWVDLSVKPKGATWKHKEFGGMTVSSIGATKQFLKKKEIYWGKQRCILSVDTNKG